MPPATARDDAAAAAPSAAAGAAVPCSFAQMRLRVGDQLQLDLPRLLKRERTPVTLVGWLEGRSVIVTAPQKDSLRLLLAAGEAVVLRTLSGTNAFAFAATVIRASNAPFNYLHLSFPDKVDGVTIRNSARCRLGAPGKITADGVAGDCTILNIGTHGALIESTQALQKEGASIKLSVSLTLHEVPVTLDLTADVRSIKPRDASEGAPNHYGIQFRDLTPNDQLVLGSLVCYQLLQDPQSVT